MVDVSGAGHLATAREDPFVRYQIWDWILAFAMPEDFAVGGRIIGCNHLVAQSLSHFILFNAAAYVHKHGGPDIPLGSKAMRQTNAFMDEMDTSGCLQASSEEALTFRLFRELPPDGSIPTISQRAYHEGRDTIIKFLHRKLTRVERTWPKTAEALSADEYYKALWEVLMFLTEIVNDVFKVSFTFKIDAKWVYDTAKRNSVVSDPSDAAGALTVMLYANSSQDERYIEARPAHYISTGLPQACFKGLDERIKKRIASRYEEIWWPRVWTIVLIAAHALINPSDQKLYNEQAWENLIALDTTTFVRRVTGQDDFRVEEYVAGDVQHSVINDEFQPMDIRRTRNVSGFKVFETVLVRSPSLLKEAGDSAWPSVNFQSASVTRRFKQVVTKLANLKALVVLELLHCKFMTKRPLEAVIRQYHRSIFESLAKTDLFAIAFPAADAILCQYKLAEAILSLDVFYTRTSMGRPIGNFIAKPGAKDRIKAFERRPVDTTAEIPDELMPLAAGPPAAAGTSAAGAAAAEPPAFTPPQHALTEADIARIETIRWQPTGDYASGTELFTFETRMLQQLITSHTDRSIEPTPLFTWEAMGWDPDRTLKYHQIQNIAIMVSAIYAHQPDIDARWDVNLCGTAFLLGDMTGLGKTVSLLGVILWIKVGQEARYKGHRANRYAFRVSVEQGRTLPLVQYTIREYISRRDLFPAVNDQRRNDDNLGRYPLPAVIAQRKYYREYFIESEVEVPEGHRARSMVDQWRKTRRVIKKSSRKMHAQPHPFPNLFITSSTLIGQTINEMITSAECRMLGEFRSIDQKASPRPLLIARFESISDSTVIMRRQHQMALLEEAQQSGYTVLVVMTLSQLAAEFNYMGCSADDPTRMHELLPDTFKDISVFSMNWAIVVLDEAHRVRKGRSKESHAIRAISLLASVRIGASATISVNQNTDAAGIMHMLRAPDLDDPKDIAPIRTLGERQAEFHSRVRRSAANRPSNDFFFGPPPVDEQGHLRPGTNVETDVNIRNMLADQQASIPRSISTYAEPDDTAARSNVQGMLHALVERNFPEGEERQNRLAAIDRGLKEASHFDHLVRESMARRLAGRMVQRSFDTIIPANPAAFNAQGYAVLPQGANVTEGLLPQNWTLLADFPRIVRMTIQLTLSGQAIEQFRQFEQLARQWQMYKDRIASEQELSTSKSFADAFATRNQKMQIGGPGSISGGGIVLDPDSALFAPTLKVRALIKAIGDVFQLWQEAVVAAEAEGKERPLHPKIVVFCQQVDQWPAIEMAFIDAEIPLLTVEGKLTGESRDVAIDEFNKDDAHSIYAHLPEAERIKRMSDDPHSNKGWVMMISDIGQEGLNLQRANWLFILSALFTPGKQTQLIGRIARIGSRHPTVHVVDFNVNNCSEELFGILTSQKALSLSFTKPTRPVPELEGEITMESVMPRRARNVGPVVRHEVGITQQINELYKVLTPTLLKSPMFDRDYLEKEKPSWMQIIIRVAAAKSLRGSVNFRSLLGEIGSPNREDRRNYDYNFTKTRVPDYDQRLRQWAGLVGGEPMEVDTPPVERQGGFEVVYVGETGPQPAQQPPQPQPQEQAPDDPMGGNEGGAAAIGGVAPQEQAAQQGAQQGAQQAAGAAANAPQPAVRRNTRLAQRPDGTMRLTNAPSTPVRRQRQAGNTVAAATPTEAQVNIPQPTFPVDMLRLANHRDAVRIGRLLREARQSNRTVTRQEIVNLGIGIVVAKKDVLSVASSTRTAEDEDEEDVDVERPSGAPRSRGRPPGATSRRRRSAGQVIRDALAQAAIPGGSQAPVLATGEIAAAATRRAQEGLAAEQQRQVLQEQLAQQARERAAAQQAREARERAAQAGLGSPIHMTQVGGLAAATGAAAGAAAAGPAPSILMQEPPSTPITQTRLPPTPPDTIERTRRAPPSLEETATHRDKAPRPNPPE